MKNSRKCFSFLIILSVLFFVFFLSPCLFGKNFYFDFSKYVNINQPPHWTYGYSLVLLSCTDVESTNNAREFIINRGGSIAVLAPPHAMVGWIPPDIVDEIVGAYGIESIYYHPVNLDEIKYKDNQTIALVKFFNYVTSGELEQSFYILRKKGDPLINDALIRPPLDSKNYLLNLKQKGLGTDEEVARLTAEGVLSPGNSDSMLGTAACCLFFVESDGSIDGNTYTWSNTAVNHTYYQCASGLTWWSNQAASRGVSLSFSLYYYDPSTSGMNQGYEPIYHSSSEDYLWINAIMSNLGFSYGSKFTRVDAFNTWLKDWAGTDWAYSAFFAYNPPDEGAPDRFTNGYFAYAYLGGPYTQLLYKNNGWSLDDIWKTLTHETGHIFWACDEYYEEGYGGCTSCDPCNYFRPIENGNCEHPGCNPYNSVPCIMRRSEDALCYYTELQVGWYAQTQVHTLRIEAGSGGTTNPVPGTYTHNEGTQVTVTAIPNNNYRFGEWGGDASGTNNPITITMDSNKSITASFIRQYKLNLTSGIGGTTNPTPGQHIYDENTKVTIKALPNTHYLFNGWSGNVPSGKENDNPISITMNSDKSLTASFLRIIYPPLNFAGEKVLNYSLSQDEYINTLTWEANPDNENIEKYRIYQIDGESSSLLVELDANTLQYWHRNVEKDKQYIYALIAVNNENREGDAANISVK